MKHSRSDTNVSLSSRATHVTPADTSWRPCFARQQQRPHKRGGRHAKWMNRKWATADGKRGAAMQRRWRLPKGVLRPRFAIKKRRFPLHPSSGIDSAVGPPWQHADVNEAAAANSVLLRWTEGSRDGVAYRDMTAMHPADNTDDRAAVSPARRQTFLARLFGACERVHFP